MPRAPAQHKSHRSSPRNRHPEALDRIGEREQLRVDYLDRVDKHRTAKRLVRRLDALGYPVMLRSKAAA